MIRDAIYRLLKPVIRWHESHRAKIIANWLKENDPDMAKAVELFQESRSSQFRGETSWAKRRARRKALRKLRAVCSDPNVRTAVRKQFPPLPNTWS